MDSRRELAKQALSAIKNALAESKEAGESVQAVFIPSDLRYVIVAYPNDAIKFSMDKGETIYDVPLIRYISDDITKFFLAQSYYADGSGGHPEVRYRPFYGMTRKENT